MLKTVHLPLVQELKESLVRQFTKVAVILVINQLNAQNLVLQ